MKTLCRILLGIILSPIFIPVIAIIGAVTIIYYSFALLVACVTFVVEGRWEWDED